MFPVPKMLAVIYSAPCCILRSFITTIPVANFAVWIDTPANNAMHGFSITRRALTSVLTARLLFGAAFRFSPCSLAHKYPVLFRITFRIFPAFFTAWHSASTFTQRRKKQQCRSCTPRLFTIKHPAERIQKRSSISTFPDLSRSAFLAFPIMGDASSSQSDCYRLDYPPMKKPTP